MGKTALNVVPKQSDPGKQWQDGRLTVVQPTTRPPTIFGEVWRRVSNNRQDEAIVAWKIEGPKREAEYKFMGKIQVVLQVLKMFSSVKKVVFPPWGPHGTSMGPRGPMGRVR